MLRGNTKKNQTALTGVLLLFVFIVFESEHDRNNR
jgi:hypothetical protein